VNLFHVHIVNGPVTRHYFIAADDRREAERHLPLDIAETLHSGGVGGFDHCCVNDVTEVTQTSELGIRFSTICDSREKPNKHGTD
jgi:hypothetical protein